MARLKETDDVKDVPQTAQEFKTPAQKTAKKTKDDHVLAYTPASRVTSSTTKVLGVELDPGILTTIQMKKKTKIPANIELRHLPSPVHLVKKGTARRGTRRKPGDEEVVEGIRKLTLSKPKGTDEKAEEKAEQDMKEVKGKKRTAKAKETKEAPESSDHEAPPEKKQPTRATRTRSDAAKTKKVMKEAIIEESDEDMEDLQLNPIGTPVPKKPTTAAAPKRTTSRKLSRTNSTVSSANLSPSSSDNEAESLSPPDPTWQKTRELILSFKGKATWATNKKLWDTEDGDIDELQESIDKLEEQNDDEATEGRLMVFKGMLEVMQSFRAFQGSLVKHLEMDWDGKEGDGSEEDDSDV